MEFDAKRIYHISADGTGADSGIMSGSAFGLSDIDDEVDRLKELPLKTKLFAKSNNFSELDQFLESRSSTPPIAKKVRFNKNDNGQQQFNSSDDNTFLSNEFDAANDSDNSTVANCQDELSIEQENNNLQDITVSIKYKESATESTTSSSTRNRQHIENLIEYASQVNDYLAQNMDNIDSFRSEVLKNEGIYKPLSNLATENSSVWDSTSNFELSDNDLDEKDKSNSFLLFNNIDRSSSGVPSVFITGNINSQLMSRNATDSEFKICSQTSLTDYFEDNNKSNNIEYSNDDKDDNKENPNNEQNINDDDACNNICTLENSPKEQNDIKENSANDGGIDLPVTNNDKINFPSIETLKISGTENNQSENVDTEICYLSSNGYKSILVSHLVQDQDRTEEATRKLEEISVESAIQLFQDTIKVLLQLTERNDERFFISGEVFNNKKFISVKQEYGHFNMKSIPTVTYEDFIGRIQSKCMFDEIIYLGSAIILQTLLLVREKETNNIKLKYHLEKSQVHRLIIGIIRIASKLLQDFVHSHDYISKVFGVSKKLLTKLEVSLLLCLKDDGIMMATEKMINTYDILDELKTMLNSE